MTAEATKFHDANAKLNEEKDRVRDVAGEIFEQATDWLEESGPRALGAIAAIAAAGLVGFLIGRNSRGSP